MKSVKMFSEYLKEGIVTKRMPDMTRARSLMKESEKSYNFLKTVVEKVRVDDANSNNIIKNAYDVVMELIRARMIADGFSSSGKGAHEAEVAYLRETGFSETEVQFANQLRYFRNGILYYGKSFDTEYAEKVLEFLNKSYAKLKT